jgi:antirestriction protein ArdC
LKNDKRLIMQASSAAQKAVEFIAEGSLSISETSKAEHAEAA